MKNFADFKTRSDPCGDLAWRPAEHRSQSLPSPHPTRHKHLADLPEREPRCHPWGSKRPERDRLLLLPW